MGEIVPFKKPQARHQGKTLCRSGFHKWEVVNDRPFDVKSGRLVTRWRCTRCGSTRTEAR
jgi:hypothetical protein